MESAIEEVDWAIGLLTDTNLNIQRRVCDGDISDDADHTREQMITDRCKRWFMYQRKDKKEEAMRVNGLIPRRYLQQEVAGKGPFKDHRLGATTAFNLTIANLVATGRLMDVDKLKLAEDYGIRGQCWRILE